MIVTIKEVEDKLINEFNCGVKELDIYFKNYALKNDIENIGKTFVCIQNNKIVGFYTLSNAQIEFNNLNEDLKKGLPRYPIPAIRIARLAVDENHKNKKFGAKLLKDAFKRILVISNQSAIKFIIVDAKETSKSFYEHYGFIKLDSYKLTYLMLISTILKAIK